MTVTQAQALYLKWFGTAHIRKPPTDVQLKKILCVTRQEWEEAVRTVEREKSKVTQVFVCKRGS